MSNLLSSFRIAIRSLGRNPVLLVAAAVCLALGIGTTATVMTVVDDLYISLPRGVQRARELVRVTITMAHSRGAGMRGLAGLVSYPVYESLRQNLGPSINVAGESESQPLMDASGSVQRVHAQLVSGNYFSMLGVRPERGRLIVPEDGAGRNAEPVAVLGHAFWQHRFAGRLGVIGQTIRINEHPFTIIGVAARDFNGVNGGIVDVWLPLGAAEQAGFQPQTLSDAQAPWIDLIAREPRGMSNAQMTFLLSRSASVAQPGSMGDARAIVRLLPIGPPLAHASWSSDEAERSAHSITVALALFASILLLVACTNVANLLLVRGLQRRKEMTVRLALGAHRRHIVQLLLAESAVLAALGGAAGLILARWGSALIRLIPGPPQPYTYSGQTALFCLTIGAASALLAGVFPSVQTLRGVRFSELRDSGKTVDRHEKRTRSLLLVMQVSLAFVLLVSASLMLHSVYNLEHVETGMALDRVLVVTRDPAAGRLPKDVDLDALLAPVAERIASLSGIEGVSIAMGAPFRTTFQARVTLPGAPASQNLDVRMDAGDTSYFRVLGIAILRGRAFSLDDMLGGQPVAVVNEAFANALWPQQDPIGQCFQWGSRSKACLRVIGIVPNTLYGSLAERPTPTFYVPLTTPGTLAPFRTILVRTRQSAEQVLASVSATLQSNDGKLRRYIVEPLAAASAPEIAEAESRAHALLWFAVVALVMVAVGLYGTMTYEIAQRTREIGIRMALGANSSDVHRMVLLDALIIAGIGLAIGMALAVVASAIFGTLLFEVTRLDPLSYGAAIILITVTALIAAYIPARIASAADPTRVLRA